MTPSLCATLAECNRWMNTRLYDSIAKLPEDRIHEDRRAFFGSIFGTLNHIAVADLLWMHRFVELPGLSELRPLMSDLPHPKTLREPLAKVLSELAVLRTNLDAVICRLAALSTDALFAETVRYTNTAGQNHAKNFGLLLQHFFNHQTHHRGQASTLLYEAGVDIGVTDFIALIPSEA